MVCVPGLNCYSCPGAVGACPLGALQNAVASSGRRVGFYIIGIFLLYGLILGRTTCGWLCPMGMLQELLHKIPTPKIRKSRITRGLSYLKYLILVILVLALPLWYGLVRRVPVPGFCKYICPAGTFEGAVGLTAGDPGYLGSFGELFTQKFVIMLFIGLACIFCFRAFCRFLCPLGAIYGFFCKLAFVGVKVDIVRCTQCGTCVRNCKMDVKKVGDRECIHCGECMAGCPVSAISMKAGDHTLIPSARDRKTMREEMVRKRKRAAAIFWAIAIGLLGLALIVFNI